MVEALQPSAAPALAAGELVARQREKIEGYFSFFLSRVSAKKIRCIFRVLFARQRETFLGMFLRFIRASARKNIPGVVFYIGIIVSVEIFGRIFSV